MEELIQKRIMESIETKKNTIKSQLSNIKKAAEMIIDSYQKGGKLICFGNGGSASDAQHIVAELINKLYLNRPMLNSIALNTNTSIITAIGNDSSFEDVFSRQIESLTKPHDIVLGLSTSGNSTNIINALIKAKDLGIKTIALTGQEGGRIKHIGTDLMINVSSKDVARIQECHITIGHIICEIVEEELFGSKQLTQSKQKISPEPPSFLTPSVDINFHP